MDKRKISILISHYTYRRHNLTDIIYDLIKNRPNLTVKLIEPENFKDESYLKSIEDKNSYEVLFLPNVAEKSAEILLQHFNNVKWVQAIGTGIERLLAVDRIRDNESITLTNLKSVSSVALAEFAMLGALYFTKEIPRFQKLAQQCEWDRSIDLDVAHLDGKRALIIGLGSIGSEIAKKCVYGFNMEVIGVKRNPNDVPDNIKAIVKTIETPDKLKDLVKTVDYIFVALPFVSEGYIITKDIVSNMKKGMIFVNVGRGKTVEEKALIEGIKNGIIKGAALDVFENEPLTKDSPFYTDPELRDRVLNTCHRMDQGENNRQKSIEIVEENLKRYINGEELMNIVDKKKGY